MVRAPVARTLSTDLSTWNPSIAGPSAAHTVKTSDPRAFWWPIGLAFGAHLFVANGVCCVSSGRLVALGQNDVRLLARRCLCNWTYLRRISHSSDGRGLVRPRNFKKTYFDGPTPNKNEGTRDAESSSNQLG